MSPIRDGNVSSQKLLRGTLSLRDHNAQVSETHAVIKALNKLTGLGMPKTKAIV
ncbi:Mobile element protein [Candidatus Enterovibrio altilux]|uniref:Mobile element protein n=1 Tax=Candidatus Enterovibrio altilux TaxID=1927128 RepID=A0A291B9R6_9GAMM|nr:Mobile element protein [Candidatus Enterovibrio luxaltus]